MVRLVQYLAGQKQESQLVLLRATSAAISIAARIFKTQNFLKRGRRVPEFFLMARKGFLVPTGFISRHFHSPPFCSLFSLSTIAAFGKHTYV
jgi:hypothetical protein